MVGTYLTGDMPQFILGGYLFSLNTAVAQEFERSTEQRWGRHERFGQMDALQYIGPGQDTIRLPGVIYPSWRGGTGQLDLMREEAALGTPLMLLDGYGNVYGRWVIESVDEKRTAFAGLGAPLKQEFMLTLRRYDGDPANNLLDFIRSLF